MKSDLLMEESLEMPDEALSSSATPEPVLETPPEPPPPTWLRIGVSLVLIVVVLGAGGGVMNLLIASRPHAAQTPTIIPPTLVESRVIQSRDVREVFVGYGSARADKSVIVAAEVGGQVVEVPDEIEDGARVKAGELLARIDNRTYRNQLERAESLLADVDAKLGRLDVEKTNVERLIEIAQRELSVNQSEYERLMDLRERNSASKKEVDFARLASEQSRRGVQTLENQRDLIPAQRAELLATKRTRETEIELARLEVERTEIRAPMDGQVERLAVERGNHVMPGAQIAQIVETDRVEVPVELPLGVRTKTHVGAAATLFAETSPGVKWQATVVRLSPTADAGSRTFLAYLEVDNREQEVPLVPGVFLTAKVQGGIIEDALVIPRGAMVEGHVFVAHENKAHRKRVAIETLIGDEAVVSGELESGDRLITSNLDILHDGATIRVEGATTTSPARKDESVIESEEAMS